MSKGIENLAGVVAPEVLINALEASHRLSELGIPHALIGGLAVGFHGHPRATKDVDYLVGNEAFVSLQPILVYREELKDMVRIGVVDFLSIPTEFPVLIEYLAVPKDDEIPVLPVEALILMKLSAGRPRDMADISSLLEAGADIDATTKYLQANAPNLLVRFAEMIS
jgi:hypothetical protein